MMDLSDGVNVKSSRLKSLVWNDFDRVRKGDTYVAICRLCKKKLSGSSTSGTSHLRNHLTRCRRRTLAISTVDQEQKEGDVLSIVNYRCGHEPVKDAIVDTGSTNFDQKRSRFDLARMVILHGYRLTMIEHTGFRVFVKNIQPLFELVTIDRLEADCMEIYAKEKQKVFELLDSLTGKVNVSVELWTASDDVEYLCLTAHYINESWDLKKKILNFYKVDPSYSEDEHLDSIMTCLMEWDIDRKLFSMSFDHSPPFNEDIINKIKGRLSQNRFLCCDGKMFDTGCAANVINLMVQDALEAVRDVAHKIRESILYVKSSQPVRSKFNELALEARVENQRCLCLDNPSQWNSTYIMLEVALEYKGAFSLLKENDPGYTMCPSDLEWERVTTVGSFLKLFIEVINVFTKSKYPTANIYFPEICDINLRLIEWCKNPDDFISSLAASMRVKFDEYWDKSHLSLAIAAILDPRFKMRLIEYYYPQLYGSSSSELINDVFDCIKALYNEHSNVLPLALYDPNQVSQNGDENTRDKLVGFDKYLHETTQTQASSVDLDKYLEEPLFPRNFDFNILNWWKVHAPRYPILSMMAHNVLGIPMSKVTLESAFNVGGRVVNHHWSLLRSSTVQALMCSQDWIRSEVEC